MVEKQNLVASDGIDDSVRADIEKIENAVRRIVTERPDASGAARRDVHRKHHGCVRGWFKVNTSIPEHLSQGVLVGGRLYPVWIRFSSSSKRVQSDTVTDGRGIAIKLLGVDGPRLREGDDVQRTTQDFVLLNGPAFFAADAKNMVVAAELDAADRFPSDSFFLKNPTGFAALQRMSSAQANSLLELVYFSQTPYAFGDELQVKYRLTPRAPAGPKKEGNRSANYLFEALRDGLAPANDDVPNEPSATDVVFDFAVQLRRDDPLFPIDDATAVWDETQSPFIDVAELRIPRQRFDTAERMQLAEDMSFNPWNGVTAHRPLGTINLARRYAYEASRKARHGLNHVKTEPDYSVEEWEAQRVPKGNLQQPPPTPIPSAWLSFVQGFSAIFPELAVWPARFLSSNLGFAVAPVLLSVLVGVGFCQRKPWFGAAIVLGGPSVMPSEDAIPPAVFVAKYRGPAFETNAAARDQDLVWTFRYASVGGEGKAGIPYWIFRALPKMLPQYFGERRDWSEFGFGDPDDQDYYTSYHDLPRGLVLTEPVANIGGTQFAAGIQLVALNCATCHRGEYIDKDGKSKFVDGMPNNGVDIAGYERASFGALRDDRFNADNVITTIDALLAEKHAPPLTVAERIVYGSIVSQAKKNAWAKPIEWMDHRPRNGLGRLNAFGTLRFEFLGFAPDWPASNPEDLNIATVDFPSLWNQRAEWRPRHHWDGNTAQERARNFGAVVGIGGTPETLRKAVIDRIGGWIDDKLRPPEYPWKSGLDAELVQTGKAAYQKECARCHGSYGDHGQLLGQTACTNGTQPVADTDPHRYRATSQFFVQKLNDFGAANSFWAANAFVPRSGYPCPPLDGIWARAPYLHNGSVPTLYDLLGPPAERPKAFERGNPVYDQEKGGFVTTAPPNRAHFTFQTWEEGNHSEGHAFVLPEDDRKAVVAYLLTL